MNEKVRRHGETMMEAARLPRHTCSALPWRKCKDAARLMGLHVNTVRRLANSGELLPCGHNGREYLFCERRLQEWLSGRGREGAA